MSNNEHPLFAMTLKVLEDWAMMLVDKAEGETSIFNFDEPLYKSEVNLHGAFSGTVAIIAQKEFMQILAANLLSGTGDEQIDESECVDAFKEMGNVLAGNFLTHAYGEDVAFDLLSPNVSTISCEEFEKIKHAKQSYYFLADDSPVCVTFAVQE